MVCFQKCLSNNNVCLCAHLCCGGGGGRGGLKWMRIFYNNKAWKSDILKIASWLPIFIATKISAVFKSTYTFDQGTNLSSCLSWSVVLGAIPGNDPPVQTSPRHKCAILQVTKREHTLLMCPDDGVFYVENIFMVPAPHYDVPTRVPCDHFTLKVEGHARHVMWDFFL